MAKATVDNIDKAVMILQDIELDNEGFKELLPIEHHVVGLQLICQYRHKDKPDEVVTLKIEHGEPVKLLEDGDVYREAAGPECFPDVLDINFF